MEHWGTSPGQSQRPASPSVTILEFKKETIEGFAELLTKDYLFLEVFHQKSIQKRTAKDKDTD